MLDLERLRELGIRPCPHCGSEALATYGYTDHNVWQVTCKNMDCNSMAGWDDTEEKAIAAWNRRANDEEIERVRAERDAAMGALEKYAHNVHTCYFKDSCKWVIENHEACLYCTKYVPRGARNEEGVG